MADDRITTRLRDMLRRLKSEESHLSIDVYDFHGTPLVTVAGELDHHTVGGLRRVVEEILREGRTHILLDMDRVTYMDSGGMSLLFDIVRTVRTVGWAGVINPGANIQRLLEITGLRGQEGFCVFPDVEAARATLPPSRED